MTQAIPNSPQAISITQQRIGVLVQAMQAQLSFLKKKQSSAKLAKAEKVKAVDQAGFI